MNLRLSRPVRGDVRRCGAVLLCLGEMLLDLPAARTRGLQIGRRVAADVRLSAAAALDLIAEGGQAGGKFRAVHSGQIRLRLVELPRLERASLPVLPLGDVEEDDVRV